MTWSPENPPKGWEGVRDRWEAAYTIRTAISAVGFGCLVADVSGALRPQPELSDSDSSGPSRLNGHPVTT